MFNIGDKFEIKISGVFVIEGGTFYAAEGIKGYLFDEDELKQLIGNSEGISIGDEVIGAPLTSAEKQAGEAKKF